MKRQYNDVYRGEYLNHVGFPLGGIGAGMLALEGTGAISHVSLYHRPDIFNEPAIFAGLCIRSEKNIARVLEGPVPVRKIFGVPSGGTGLSGKTYGLPRFTDASFQARFPFAKVTLTDPQVPLRVEITGWSPFTPPEADDSSLPVAAIEYRFGNTSAAPVDAVFSFNAENFMTDAKAPNAVEPTSHGFLLRQFATETHPHLGGDFAAFVLADEVYVNPRWFRGRWFDSMSIAWGDVESARTIEATQYTEGAASPGGTLSVPLGIPPGAEITIQLLFAWFVPSSDLRLAFSWAGASEGPACTPETPARTEDEYYAPWYAERFGSIEDVASYWESNYARLRAKSKLFADCFYESTLPPEVLEAVAANLTILKSPTILRQSDGRVWAFEGCSDREGCCIGSCTHVWNYAQAIAHLFPSLERTLRQTEFGENQDERGHQSFRASLPIRPGPHGFLAAADGQLGGVMKVHREWRISGDTDWLRRQWAGLKQSMLYCIETWDPEHLGAVREPHHTTYDIELWGPDSMCTTFYLGALKAMVLMGEALGESVSKFEQLADKAEQFLREQLYNGEYFIQKVQWKDLRAEAKTFTQNIDWKPDHSEEARELIETEGPKYQYGDGCLSDGVIGAWMGRTCGMGDILDTQMVKSHLQAVYRYNFRRDLSAHANPQRPGFAMGREGGLLLCTWPHGPAPTLPFIYSNEVWTGIEYEVASHLMMMGCVDEGLEIVRAARDRYDGRVRNPFDEYECGHWYARALSSYALLQGLTGARYDAVDRTLTVAPSIVGDFQAFLCTEKGFALVGVREGEAFLDVRSGEIPIENINYVPKR